MIKNLTLLITLCITLPQILTAQDTDRKLPEEWKDLVHGARFIDRFLPLPDLGGKTAETWGAESVLPRDINNGIEDTTWSYWGGNIRLLEDGKYHLFVCRWLEDSPKGHKEWQRSIVVHAVSDNSFGPYNVIDEVGKGHNPEWFITEDGKYVVYIRGTYYISDNVNGPWEHKEMDYNSRDRKIIERLSNFTFAKREDGSMIMICRGGGVWISKDGVSTWNQISNGSVYPKVEGRFEDPVIWRDHIQYHLIVNDWLGRIAWYLRSKDGIHWKTDDGEAYLPGIAIQADRTKEDWYKFERIKMFQDEYGRAIQANFAVIDTIKKEDLGNDHHSSKNLSIPLVVDKLITIQNNKRINEKTKKIILKIEAEDGFNPNADIKLESLRLGASEEVNYGRGAKAISIKADGKDAIITFDGLGNGITKDNFVAKMLGEDKNGNLLIGYARLPKVAYLKAYLSPLKPKVINENEIEIEVQNFGQIGSKKSSLKLVISAEGETISLGTASIPVLKPFEKAVIKVFSKSPIEGNGEPKFVIIINDSQETVFSDKYIE